MNLHLPEMATDVNRRLHSEPVCEAALTRATDPCAVAQAAKIPSKSYHLSVTDAGKNSIISQHATAYKLMKTNGTGCCVSDYESAALTVELRARASHILHIPPKVSFSHCSPPKLRTRANSRYHGHAHPRWRQGMIAAEPFTA